MGGKNLATLRAQREVRLIQKTFTVYPLSLAHLSNMEKFSAVFIPSLPPASSGDPITFLPSSSRRLKGAIYTSRCHFYSVHSLLNPSSLASIPNILRNRPSKGYPFSIPVTVWNFLNSWNLSSCI